jgi:hypothetical protein
MATKHLVPVVWAMYCCHHCCCCIVVVAIGGNGGGVGKDDDVVVFVVVALVITVVTGVCFGRRVSAQVKQLEFFNLEMELASSLLLLARSAQGDVQ